MEELLVKIDCISILITLLGFVVTFRTIKEQNKLVEKSKNKDEKRKVYYATYEILDELLSNRMLLFDRTYYENLYGRKSIIKIIGSNKVINEYGRFLKEFNDNLLSYETFYYENDPRNKKENYKVLCDEDDNETDLSFEGKNDLPVFDRIVKEYQECHCMSREDIIKTVDNILNCMREDVDNDSYKREKTLN